MKVTHNVASAMVAIVNGATAHGLETDRLDCKQTDRDLGKALTDLADAAVCFAHSSGGCLVVGIANRPGASAPSREPRPRPNGACYRANSVNIALSE